MDRIVIPIIVLTVTAILIIQTVTVRLTWHKGITVGIDYMFFAIHHKVKRSKKPKKQKKYILPLFSLAKEILSHSTVVLHKTTIAYTSDDYADEYFKSGAIQGILFPALSAVRAISKKFIIEDGAIQMRSPDGSADTPYLDFSIQIRLFHLILSSLYFLKSYLKKKAKEAK